MCTKAADDSFTALLQKEDKAAWRVLPHQKAQMGRGGGTQYGQSSLHMPANQFTVYYLFYFLQWWGIGLITQHVNIKLYLHLSLGNSNKHYSLATQDHTFGGISIFNFRMEQKKKQEGLIGHYLRSQPWFWLLATASNLNWCERRDKQTLWASSEAGGPRPSCKWSCPGDECPAACPRVGVRVGAESVDITPWPCELINIHWPV